MRRYADDTLSRIQGPDVDSTAEYTARLLAIRTGFREGRWCRALYTASNGINLISDLHSDHVKKQINKIKPRHIQIDIGSNDLARLTKKDVDHAGIIAKRACNKAAKIIEAHHSVRSVTLFSVLPREANISCDEAAFLSNAESYSTALKKLCTTTPGVHFERLRGFIGIDVATAKPIEMWSEDLIHMRTAEAPPGTTKQQGGCAMDCYRKRVFFAIKHYLSDQ